MIEIDRVSVRFDGRVALDSVSLAIAGGRTALLGANGSGKSTLARLMNGLCLPSEGTVRVDGLDTSSHGRQVRRLVGFVFQNPDNQIVFPVVHEDMRFGLRNIGVPRGEIGAIVEATLSRFGLSHLRDRQAHTLSGGEKQLLALAGVVAMSPAYIVFDEPTTLLDLRNRNRVAQVIAGLEMPTIIATHDLDLAAACDRAVVLDGGKIVFAGDAAQAVAIYRERMA